MNKQGVAGRGAQPCGPLAVPSPSRLGVTLLWGGARGVLDRTDITCVERGWGCAGVGGQGGTLTQVSAHQGGWAGWVDGG